MRLVFMGTPEFAVKSLELIHSSKHEISAVVTSPDKPRGRGRKLSPTPVKSCALKFGLPLLQPDNLEDDEFVNQLKKYDPDLIVVVAFRILPEIVFTLPRIGSINLHASLLPAYRGAAPINRVLINGETKTGVTTFFLNRKVDTGDILLQREVEITDADNFGSLHDKLMIEGADLLLETINGIEDGNLEPQPQDSVKVSAAPKLTHETGLINWDMEAEKVRNLIRGLSPSPGAYCFSGSKKLIIMEAEVVANDSDSTPGTVIESDPKKGFTVACGKNSLFIRKLKPQGKKVINSAEYVRGYRVETGNRFSN